MIPSIDYTCGIRTACCRTAGRAGLGWTEYTLHFTAACALGLRDKLFDTAADDDASPPPLSLSSSSPVSPSPSLGPELTNGLLYEDSGFAWHSFDPAVVAAEFGRGAVFGVVQSISGADPADVNLAIAVPMLGAEPWWWRWRWRTT